MYRTIQTIIITILITLFFYNMSNDLEVGINKIKLLNIKLENEKLNYIMNK